MQVVGTGNLKVQAGTPPGGLVAGIHPGGLAGTRARPPQKVGSRLAGSLVELVEQQPLMMLRSESFTKLGGCGGVTVTILTPRVTLGFIHATKLISN